MHIIVFSPRVTPRIRYIFNFIFKDVLATDVEFTTDHNDFLKSEQPKISYAEHPVSDELFFKNTKLLLSGKVEEIKLKTIAFSNYQVPFPVEDSALPFDVFAASFFMISRYEEYLHHNNSDADFSSEDSLQYKWKVLKKPVIDEWALLIKNMIRKRYPSFKFPEKSFQYQATINFMLKPDVPTGFIPKTKFIFTSLFNKQQSFLSSAFDLTGLGIKSEQVINDLEQINIQSEPLYFIDFPQDDKNRLTFEQSTLLLRKKQVGLFMPCTGNIKQSVKLKSDLLKLGKIQNHTANFSSQQLEAFKLPSCYLHLISSGITSDFSMGYPDKAGFRAGTCTPFNWYDLQLEKATTLNVKSYCITDSALQYFSTVDAIEIIRVLIDAIKLINGHFYSSWQLKNLSENVRFKKWRTVFDEMIKYAG